MTRRPKPRRGQPAPGRLHTLPWDALRLRFRLAKRAGRTHTLLMSKTNRTSKSARTAGRPSLTPTESEILARYRKLALTAHARYGGSKVELLARYHTLGREAYRRHVLCAS